MRSKEKSNLLIANKNEKNTTVYVKKFKNNFYDRKLWNTLRMSDEAAASSSSSLGQTPRLNIYAESSARDYNSEFDILNRLEINESGRGI